MEFIRFKIRAKNRSKNKLVCENAVTQPHGNCSLPVMCSWWLKLPKRTPFGWSIPPPGYYSSWRIIPFLPHLSHGVLCSNHFANHKHHHGSYQQVLRQNCPMDSHLTSIIRNGLKLGFENKSNVARTAVWPNSPPPPPPRPIVTAPKVFAKVNSGPLSCSFLN